MAVPILQQGCSIQCMHGAPATVVSTNMRVMVGGAPALLKTDVFTVVGCPFQIPPVPTPSPCITIEWTAEATLVTVGGTAVLLQTSVGLCKNAQGAVQGTAIVSGVQTQVMGT